MRYVLLCMGLASAITASAESEGGAQGDNDVYEPTRESLSRYQVPEWFHDAKIGFFYHWGPHSVIGDHWNEDVMDFCRQQGKYAGSNLAKRNPPGQWAANMYPRPGKPQSERGTFRLYVNGALSDNLALEKGQTYSWPE